MTRSETIARKWIGRAAWFGEYHYLSPGSHGEIDVWSLGAEQQHGGEADAKAIGNWDLGRR